MGLSMSTININRNNCHAIKRYIQHGPFIQEVEITATLATGGSGVCSCCTVTPSICMQCFCWWQNHQVKGLPLVTACSGIHNFTSSNNWINRFKRHNTVYRNPTGESRRVHSEIVDDCKPYRLLHANNDIRNIQNRNIFNQHPIRPSDSLTLDRNSQHDKTKPKQRGTLLLVCHSDRKLPPIANWQLQKSTWFPKC